MDNNVQPPFNNGGYAPHQAAYQQDVSPVISVKEWLLTALLMLIPIVNIVMIFVFAFGEGNPTKKNYFKASLIMAAIILGLYLLVFVLIFGVLFSSNSLAP